MEKTIRKNQEQKTLLIEVAIPIFNKLSEIKTFHYLNNLKLNIKIGTIVKVSFGTREIWGLALGLTYTTCVSEKKLKNILDISDLPAININNITFLKKVSDWTLTPLGSIVKLMLCEEKAFKYKKFKKYYFINPKNIKFTEMRSQKQKEIYKILKKKIKLNIKQIMEEANCSKNTVLKLEKEKKLLFDFKKLEEEKIIIPDNNFLNRNKSLKLNEIQKKTYKDILLNGLKNFNVNFLDGITGSGKTEIYFEIIFNNLIQKKQSLILLPEISLTNDWKNRFKKSFNFEPLIWHSSVQNSNKIKIWRAALRGDPIVVAGARSSLFLPFSNLGIIVVDEEHDAGYKQEEKVIYHARDMAIFRAQTNNIPILLASATPSLDTWLNAGANPNKENINIQNKYWHHWKLNTRFGNANLPIIKLIDLKTSRPKKGCWLAPETLANLSENLTRKEQSLLFLNRRGYAPITICEECGYKVKCNHCDTQLVYHKFKEEFLCHYCGKNEKKTESCPKCNSVDSLRGIGPGVEKLKEEVKINFPKAKVEIFSSDLISSSENLENFYKLVTNGEIDILIGTQIVAKGHNFPNLTFVAVVDADIGFNGGDLRAGEKTFQLLIQVSGRAGRSTKPGRVFIQTLNIIHIKAINFDNFTGDKNLEINLKLINARDKFYLNEALMRRSAKMPPFGNLATITVKGRKYNKVEEFANQISILQPVYEGVRVFGPSKPPLEKIRDNFRMRFLISSNKEISIQKIIFNWLNKLKFSSSVKIEVDIDPYNFL